MPVFKRLYDLLKHQNPDEDALMPNDLKPGCLTIALIIWAIIFVILEVTECYYHLWFACGVVFFGGWCVAKFTIGGEQKVEQPRQRKQERPRPQPTAPLPPPLSFEERAAAAGDRYAKKRRLIEASEMDETERIAALERAKQLYLREIDGML